MARVASSTHRPSRQLRSRGSSVVGSALPTAEDPRDGSVRRDHERVCDHVSYCIFGVVCVCKVGVWFVYIRWGSWRWVVGGLGLPGGAAPPETTALPSRPRKPVHAKAPVPLLFNMSSTTTTAAAAAKVALAQLRATIRKFVRNPAGPQPSCRPPAPPYRPMCPSSRCINHPALRDLLEKINQLRARARAWALVQGATRGRALAHVRTGPTTFATTATVSGILMRDGVGVSVRVIWILPARARAVPPVARIVHGRSLSLCTVQRRVPSPRFCTRGEWDLFPAPPASRARRRAGRSWPLPEARRTTSSPFTRLWGSLDHGQRQSVLCKCAAAAAARDNPPPPVTHTTSTTSARRRWPLPHVKPTTGSSFAALWTKRRSGTRINSVSAVHSDRNSPT